MSAVEPGLVVGDSPCCLYCHATGDTVHAFLPCGHIICAACCQGVTISVVRVISPHSLTPQPSALSSSASSDQQVCEAEAVASACVFCIAAVRWSNVPCHTLDMLRCVVGRFVWSVAFGRWSVGRCV
eukprot:TRINITY_DN5436_c0_g1_i2.p1 TRINITY_DN5436_c0_g1~~TRINITY_DN5436_c0_g1_i2.p1  ORF type:complete len:127 (-),score=20.77 TRINITY_DN5436_c0_g1_i2:50-430(-)